jgi:cysteine protease ATG4
MESFRKKFGLKTTGAQNGQSSSSEAEPGSTKGKLMSTWYNMKYGKTLFSLDANTSFSTQSPVWLLGQCYHRKLRQSLDYEQQVQKLNVVDSGITSFYEDFSSKIWFTYRRNFEDFKGTNINTDCGWGCMIRSGQMLLANALLVHKLGRGWRWKLPTNQVCTAEDVYDELTHRDIVRVFGDSSNTSVTPLSIHNMMEIANSSLNRQPGDWFGPTSTAHIIKQSVAKSQCHELLQCLRVYVAKDSTVYKGDIYSLCMEAREQIKGSSSYDSLINIDEYSILDPNEILVPQLNSQQFENENSVPYLLPDCDKISVENERNVCCSPVIGPYRPQHRRSLSVPGTNQQTWTPVLILIPVKLGRDHKLNPIYSPCLKSLLSVDSCVGVIGGKPKHSLFFVGFQVNVKGCLSSWQIDPNVNSFMITGGQFNSPGPSFSSRKSRYIQTRL